MLFLGQLEIPLGAAEEQEPLEISMNVKEVSITIMIMAEEHAGLGFLVTGMM